MDDLQEIQGALSAIAVVGDIDGHDVIRRSSVIDIIEARILRKATESQNQSRLVDKNGQKSEEY